ncbi:hypothetical protein LOD99_3027 [Oopsacas minuta]|uniref:Coilin N-terminal domain-containing protein n=1 Tax=Oopsacas minuta TaxID=111878 RepID=A0AAV7JYR6_9METZ|nr:hypothetical protein LOD99_3027 [Oopsacas minuta]
MTLLANQNFVTIPPPVIRVKLSFHSNEKIQLPGDTWHLLEFNKTPLVADIVEQIKFRFPLSKNSFVTLSMKDAIILKSEKSQIFRDEDTIMVNITSHTKPSQQGINANKKVKFTQPINSNTAKRKTAVVGSPPKFPNRTQPIRNEYPPQSDSSSSDSSDQSDNNKSTKTESVLFIPRQVPGAKNPSNQSSAITAPNQKPMNHSSSSSSSSEADISLQYVLRGDKHVRFSKQSKQPINLRPRGRGRAFGRIPPELSNRMGPPPPVGRGKVVTADTDKLKTKNTIFVNKPEVKKSAELLDNIPSSYSHLQAVTSALPPKIGDVIIFKVNKYIITLTINKQQTIERFSVEKGVKIVFIVPLHRSQRDNLIE